MAKTNQHEQHQQRMQLAHVDGVGGVGIVMLLLGMCSLEACMAFNLVYLILMLQYLGTPVSLMSTPGVFAGVTSLIIMPVLSYYANGCNNSWKRKWYTICIGVALYLTGLFLLVTAGVIKIADVSMTLENLSNTPNFSLYSVSSNASGTNHNFTIDFKYKNVPLTAILGIVGFGVTDMSYDIVSPAVKSFVLDTLPSHQHSIALATSALIQGLGGTMITAISLFDLPTTVESIFDVDGLAGTFLFLCLTLIALLVIGFSATLISGFVVGGWMGKRGDAMYKCMKNDRESEIKSYQKPERRIRFKYKPLSNSSAESESISLDLSFTKKTAKPTDQFAQKYKCPNSRKKMKQPKSDYADEQKSLLLEGEHRHAHSSYIYGKPQHSEILSKTDQATQTGAGAHFLRSTTHKYVPDLTSCYGVTPTTLYLKNKRVIITCISCFFANGCLMSFSLYSSNALTIGIYKGDPLALPGFPGRQQYEKGIRHGSVGILLMYISHLVFSACTHKVMRTIGEKPHYFVVCIAILSSITTLVATQAAESFFVAMAIFGSFRSCSITTPFVIVSKIVTEEILRDNGEDGGKNMGGAISLLGMMMPAQYLVLSSALGPLIGATGNVWVPMFYAIAVLLASAASLGLLYCVPHKKQ